MSALAPKADMACCGNSLSRSLLGVKRTWAVAPHMSAFDPKRTWLDHGPTVAGDTTGFNCSSAPNQKQSLLSDAGRTPCAQIYGGVRWAFSQQNYLAALLRLRSR